MKITMAGILCSVFLMASCSFKGNFGGLTSNYKQSKARRPDLFIPVGAQDNFCALKPREQPAVYLIRAAQLNACIAQYEQALVYIWKPNCKSEKCHPLHYYQRICDTRNTELFVVAEYFDEENMSVMHHTTHPIAGIDIDFYRSNLTSKYLPRFIAELTRHDTEDTKRSYYYFKKGRLVLASDNFENLFNE